MKASSVPQPPVPLEKKWRGVAEHRLLNTVMSLMVVTLVAAVLYPHVVITVPTGHVGVLWKRLGGFGIYCWCVVPRGTVLAPGELREEGLHIIWPWDTLYLYDLRLQTATRTYNAISQDGVSLTATISVRYQLKHDSVAQLHKFIGPDYAEMVISPVIGSRARGEIAKHGAEDVYSKQRSQIQDDIRKSAQDSLEDQLNRLVQAEGTGQIQTDVEKQKVESETRIFPSVNQPKKEPKILNDAIQILDTPVLGIELPPAVVASINRKIEQLYIAQEYDYRVQREILELKRKGIEAEGIRQFQQTVSQGISDSYLRWRGIEATLQLAQSNNAKIVIIGSGKDGLPIILGNVDTPVPQQTPAGAGTTSTDTNRLNRPAIPLERSPAPGLPTPSENKPPDSAPAPAPPPDKPQTLLPRSLSEIQSMIFRVPDALRSTGPAAGSSPP